MSGAFLPSQQCQDPAQMLAMRLFENAHGRAQQKLTECWRAPHDKVLTQADMTYLGCFPQQLSLLKELV
jgi:hypothetical protein